MALGCVLVDSIVTPVAGKLVGLTTALDRIVFVPHPGLCGASKIDALHYRAKKQRGGGPPFLL